MRERAYEPRRGARRRRGATRRPTSRSSARTGSLLALGPRARSARRSTSASTAVSTCSTVC
jgi:hypothetical protein